MMRPVLLAAFALFLTACGSAQPAPALRGGPDECTPEECGPAPTTPEALCEDGVSISGPSQTCTRDAEGTCGYAVRTCPASAEQPAQRACGGMVAGQNTCAEGEFCDFPREATCGAADGTGVCRARPEACTEEYAPVCGCDDHTYPNACNAAAAGVSVGADGACPERFGAAGDTCGTRGVPQCGEGLFCDFPAASICGRADGPGTCVAKPETCSGRARPVCGCDGTTYPSACAANQAGVSVETNRACRAR